MLKISPSSASIAGACWKKYYWRYIERIKPVSQHIRLQQGSIIHQALDYYYKARPHKLITKYIIDAFDEELAKVSLPDQEDLEVAKAVALGMWLGFPVAQHAQYKVVGSERDFQVRLGKLRSVRLIGKTDRTLLHGKTWWCGETKLTSMSERAFAERAEISSQATAYVYAMQQMGMHCQGVIYDCIKKPLLRKGRSETASQFCKRIIADYQRRPDFYYYTYKTFRSPANIQTWLKDISWLIRDVRYHKQHNYWPRNTHSCYQFNSECPYFKVCFSEPPDKLVLELYYKKAEEVSNGEKQPNGNTRKGAGPVSSGGNEASPRSIKGTDQSSYRPNSTGEQEARGDEAEDACR